MSKAYKTLGSPDCLESQPKRQILAGMSHVIARCERVSAGAVLAGVFSVVLLNVIARTAGQPVIWADELSIYGMAWAAFVGASAGLSGRDHIAITLLPDALPSPTKAKMRHIVDLCLFVLLLCFAGILWRWFDPIAFLSAPSADQYTMQTFNFMHQEPTTTLGIGKLWVWLVLPVFNTTALIHVSARLFGGAR
jgi:TRAP-type C4-dicarboxylate transport system permease small subunit